MAFKNKKDRFASLLHDIAVNLREGANFFASFNINSIDDLHIFSDKIKEYETTGDTMVHKIIMELNDAFITPIEREDMLELTNRLDDIMDGLEETAFSLEICQITHYDDYMVKLIEAIQSSTVEIERAVDLVFDKN
ncbi:Phosphate transport regulator (distant homolog of PhoU) [Listeria grayi]|uniref:Phosphate transport regulator (Distant homolog of PhoU) n=1 Tax=Listeria grayi TaxID=1641 RepID=A0A378MCQ1_LISGR|nr:Phosphate transport regulator (distant homolog of PhoU) [Listeria grayi]